MAKDLRRSRDHADPVGTLLLCQGSAARHSASYPLRSR